MENLTLKDFEDMEEIDHQYFQDDNITPAKEAFKWYVKDPNSITALKQNGRVVAYVNFLSLKEDVYNKIKNNLINESQTKIEDMEVEKDKYMQYLYLASIAVDKDHRDLKTITKLFLKCRKNLIKACKNANITEVMADCSTKEGRQIAEKILKMKPYRKTSHGSEIYIVNGKDFRKNLKI